MAKRLFSVFILLLLVFLGGCAGDGDGDDFVAKSVITVDSGKVSAKNTGDIVFSGSGNIGLDSLIQVEKPFDDQSDWPFSVKKSGNSFTVDFDGKKELPNKMIRLAVSGLKRALDGTGVYVTGYMTVTMRPYLMKKRVTISVTKSATRYQAAQEGVGWVNIERKKTGAAKLVYNEDLQAAAEVRALEISQSFSHTRPDGSSCFSASPNKAMSGENIASAGAASPKVVIGLWMGSAGHKANILNKSFKTMGLAGYCKDKSNYVYWSQNFGW